MFACLNFCLCPSLSLSPRLASPRLHCPPPFHRGGMQEPARDGPHNTLQNLQATQAPSSPSQTTQAPSAAAPTRAMPQLRAKLIEMDAEDTVE